MHKYPCRQGEYNLNTYWARVWSTERKWLTVQKKTPVIQTVFATSSPLMGHHWLCFLCHSFQIFIYIDNISPELSLLWSVRLWRGPQSPRNHGIISQVHPHPSLQHMQPLKSLASGLNWLLPATSFSCYVFPNSFLLQFFPLK